MGSSSHHHVRAAAEDRRENRTGRRVAAITIVLCASAAAAFGAGGGSANVWHVGPVPDVRAICHAGDSLWVGTGAGLFVIDIRDPSRRTAIAAGAELPSNSVRAIVARGDSVFVGTDAGLSIFSGGRASVLSARAGRSPVPLRLVQQIAFGSKGEILLATRRGGVGVLTGTKGYAITRRDSLLDDNIYDILERAGRPRLYACGAGLCAQVDDTTFVSFQAGAGIPRGEVRQVVGDAQTAYLRVARRGIFRFDGMRAVSVDAPPGVSFVDASSIALGPDHALWVAGAGWVVVGRGGKWERADTAPQPDQAWRVIVADGAGAFVGSADGVILALNRGAAFRASLGDGLPAPAVASLRPDGRGSAWFVSGGRVVSADMSARRVSVEKSPLDAQAVDFSPTGGLLVATRWTVSRKNDGAWSDMTPDVTGGDPSFASVCVDAHKMVWVGTRSGALYRYDGTIWLRYEQPATMTDAPLRDARAYPVADWALLGAAPVHGAGGTWSAFAAWDSSTAVVDVAASPAGDWYAASRDRIYRYDEVRDTWQTVGPGGPASGTAARWDAPAPITSIAFDGDGRLFIGTEDGFGCLVAKKTRWWSAGDGIGGGRVVDLAADASTLWVGYGEDGFSAIALNELR